MNVTRSSFRRPVVLLLALVALPLMAVPGAALDSSAAATSAPSDAVASVLSTLEFRNIGSAIMGGRIADLAVVEDDPSTFYVGTASSGVWKTTNYGTTWTPVFDDQETASIGDVTVSQQNPNLVWVGTGEPQNRQSSPYGAGAYKSVDGGRSWEFKGLLETRHIGRIRIDPRDHDTVFVAAVGHLWGPNEERGVFRTRDGGDAWEKVLYLGEDTGAIDLAMDPRDPDTLFAAMYQRRRTSFGFNGGGPNAGLYRTTDGGDTWEELTEGLPEGVKGRIGVSIYRRNPDIVMAIVEAPGDETGVYKSTDRGDTWEHLSTTNNRPMYYSQIRIDPGDPDRIYLGGADLYVSEDGGRNFRDDAAEDVHLDHHALWIDPDDSNNLILGSDGGVSLSFDRTESWRQLTNFTISQFYEIGVDMRDPYYVCGGLQDNGSWCGPSETWSTLGIRNGDWYNISGGDGFYVRIDPDDPTVVFSESQNGNVRRVDPTTGQSRGIEPLPREQGAGPDPEIDDRWNWNTPIVISEHDPQTIYVGSNRLMKSTDRGHSWEAVSSDLTRAVDRDELEIMGVQVRRGETLSAHDGIGSYGNFTTISESPLDPDVLYAGTDDGNLQGTRDGGATWELLNQDMPGVPDGTYVSRVTASHHAPGRVYATFDGHDRDDYRPYVYVSDDHGNEWTPIVDGLPDDASVNVLTEHPRNPDLLFLGNEVGAFFSTDRGGTWTRFENGLPTVPVDDIKVHPRENDLVLGTHGRGIWILDDITPLEEMSTEVLESDAHLFSAQRATMFSMYSPQGWSPGIWRAPNPPSGALIRYYLREDEPLPEPEEGEEGGEEEQGGGGPPFGRFGGGSGPPQDDEDEPPEPTVTLQILDAGGEVVRTFDGPGEAGVQQAVWDLRHDSAMDPDEFEGGGRFFFRGARGPRVLPGTYTVRLQAAGRTLQTDLEVRLDPRVEMSRQELEDRQAVVMDAFDLARPVFEANRALQQMNQRLADFRELVAEREAEDVREDLMRLTRDVSDAEDELDDVSDGAGAAGAIESWSGPPTEDQLWEIDRAWERVPEVFARINALASEVTDMAGRIYQPGFEPDPIEPLDVPTRRMR